MALCTTKALWVRKLLLDFAIPKPPEGIQLYADNSNALDLASTGKQTAKSKHIDVAFHLTQDYCTRQLVKISYMTGKTIPAGGLTKPLEKINFREFVKYTGLKDI